MLQDFSIFFPFITEEIFQEIYHNNKSIHTTEIEPLKYMFNEEVKYGDEIINIISEARGAKTNNNVSLKTPIKNLSIGVSKELEKAINESIKDFKATLFIQNLDMKNIDENYKVYDIELELEEEK